MAKNKKPRENERSSEATTTKQVTTEAPFENLRQKIENNLKKTEPSGKDKATAHKKASTTNPDSPRGKKRGRDGIFKEENKQKSDSSKEELDLRTVIAELGGTEEDLDLINGAESESDLEGSDGLVDSQKELKKGKSLESGMANILKEIALVRDTHQDVDDDAEQKVNGTAVSQGSQADTKSDSQDEMVFKSAATEIRQHTKDRNSKLRFTPKPDWYHFEPIQSADSGRFPSSQVIDQLHSHGKKLLQEENENYKSINSKSSSQSFYNTVIASGTLSDKISALTLAVQESPLHNVKALEGLLGLAKKRSRSQAVDVLRALKDLFAQGSMLPSDRKLYTFATQPGLSIFNSVKSWQEGDRLPTGVRDAHLIAWAFEDWLKDQYFEILKVLETWCNDEIEFAKTRATSYVYELLKEKPEQEANLLRLLINKLGDPVKKIASQASYLIMQLLTHHPVMKEVVISAIDSDFIFKPGQSTHAKYYAAVTLNQTALRQKEEAIAKKLLDIYFGLFRILLKPNQEREKPKPAKHLRQKKQAAEVQENEQEEELHEKLISAVLTGVNRAYPYCGTDHQAFESHLDTLFQITHSANFNTGIQAMMLIQQLTSSTSAAGPSDRFYRTLYESLLDPRLITSSKQQLYLNLLHRSLKADLNQKRVKAFVKRIFQTLSLQEPSFICGAFFLIKDLEKTFPSVATMLDQPEDHDDDEDAIYNMAKRDPTFANADAACLWDVLPYLDHYHPSVNVSAEHILEKKALPGKPDLTIHTLIHFLDRFVYKSKLSGKMRGSSIMQPVASDNKLLLTSHASGSLPVNTAEFLAKSNVSADDAFFHQYFKTVGKTTKTKSKKSAIESDEDDEDAIWDAMVKSGQDVDGIDDDMSDIEDFDGEMSDDDEAEASDIDDGVDVEGGIFDDSDEEDDHAVEDESEFEGLDPETEKKKPSKKTQAEKENRERRKKLKALPTFASAEDYMQMLEDNEGEDVG